MMARDAVSLVMRQQPERAQVVPESGNKNRKPIDPPPMIELKYDARNDPYNKEWLVSPRLFMMGQLVSEDNNDVPYLAGQTTSSLHKLKEAHADKDGGFFIFGDMSVKKVGKYKLRFHLFDMTPSTRDPEEGGTCELLASIESDIFEVKNSREFGSMTESTTLTKTFSDQGVKLRVRKQDPRSAAGQKRSFGSPEGISPTRNASIYGGTVPDDYSNSPMYANKRQRSMSNYDSTNYYQDTPLSTQQYGSADRAARYSMSSTQSLGGGSMPYQSHSRGQSQSYTQPPMSSYSMARQAGYMSGLQYPSISQQSALPSYSTSSQAYYHQAAQPHAYGSTYQPQTLPDTHSHQDLSLSSTRSSDLSSTSLGGQDQGYYAESMPANGLFGQDGTGAQAAYSFSAASDVAGM